MVIHSSGIFSINTFLGFSRMVLPNWIFTCSLIDWIDLGSYLNRYWQVDKFPKSWILLSNESSKCWTTCNLEAGRSSWQSFFSTKWLFPHLDIALQQLDVIWRIGFVHRKVCLDTIWISTHFKLRLVGIYKLENRSNKYI